MRASAVGDRQKLINTPCSIQNSFPDSAVHAIQDHLAQVWIIEKTEKERNDQEYTRDGVGIGGEEQH